MTKEQERISNINKQKAREYFGITDKPWLVPHHINPEWRHDDIERYIQWNPGDLVIMTRSEHASLHWTFDHDERAKKISDSLKGKPKSYDVWNKGKTDIYSDDTLKKISEARIGKTMSEETKKKISESLTGENNPMYGKNQSEESKRKMSNSLKGLHKGMHWKLVDGKRVWY